MKATKMKATKKHQMKPLAIAVSSVVYSTISSAIKKHQTLITTALVVQILATSTSYGGPTGGSIVGGTGQIDQSGSLTQIHQESQHLAIDWSQFNVGQDEVVQFLQPSELSIVLNRIMDESPSVISGLIQGNGHVVLVNTSGIVFTETATVNVGSLVASGLDISSEDFMKGNFAFKAKDGTQGIVINKGLIEASMGVALMGNAVANEGTEAVISAEFISLNAASEAALIFDTGGMIGVKVSAEVLENELGIKDAIKNSGELQGSRVLLSADVSSDLFTTAVNNEGLIIAKGIDTEGGVIRLVGQGGNTVNRGALDVSSDEANGGRIEVLGDAILVSQGAVLDASGATGGGDILIGGDYQGQTSEGPYGSINNAEVVTVETGVDINANATVQGQGGKVIVWADDTARFNGSIEARGAGESGDGGFVETSGKRSLIVGGSVNVGADQGQGGSWLLDPLSITISNDPDTIAATATPFQPDADGSVLNAATLNAALLTGDVTVQTVSDVSGLGNIVIEGSAATGGAVVIGDSNNNNPNNVSNSLTLTAHNDITLQSGSSIEMDSGFVDFEAGNDITLESGSSIELVTGGVNFDAENNISLEGTSSIKSDSGAVQLNANNDISTHFGSLIQTASGAVTLIANYDFDGGGNLNHVGIVSSTAGGVITTDSVNFTSILGTVFSFGKIEINTGRGGQDSINVINNLFGDDVSVNGNSGQDSYGILHTDNAYTIDGGDESDTIHVISPDSEWQLLGSDNNVQVGEVSLLQFEEVTGSGDDAVLAASNVNDSSGSDFVFESNTSATVDGILFTSIDTFSGGDGNDTFATNSSISLVVDAGDGEDTVIGTTGFNQFQAAGTGEVLLASGGTFNDIENAQGAGLTGTTGDDAFVLSTSGDVQLLGVDYTVATVAGGGGNDDLTGDSNGSHFRITANTAATVDSVDFTAINVFRGGDGADTFTAVGNLGITVDGGGGNDTVNGNSNDSFLLNNHNKQIELNGATFTNIELVNGDGGSNTLNTDAAGSVVLITGSGEATAYGVDFTGIDTFVGGVGDDTFSLTTDVTTSIDMGDGDDTLLGSNTSDTFALTGDPAEVLYRGTTFSSVEIVDGNGGTTDVVNAASTGSSFNITANTEAVVDGISFVDVDGFSGRDGNDTFSVAGTVSLTVDAGSGDDTVMGTVGFDEFGVTGISEQVLLAGATFNDIELVQGGGAGGVSASGLGSDFVFDSDSAATIDDIGFSGINSFAGGEGADRFSTNSGLTITVDAGAGEDVVVGTTDHDVLQLTGNTKELLLSGATFQNIETAEGASLVGSAGDDTFVLADQEHVIADEIDFDINSVDGGAGDDSVVANASGSVFVMSSDSTATVDNKAFSGMETFAGAAGDDHFSLTGVMSNTIDAGDGTDTLVGSTVELTGDSKTLISSGGRFSNIEIAESSILMGSAGDDNFLLLADANVSVQDMLITTDSVTGNLGDDSVDAFSEGSQFVFSSDSAVVADGVSFTEIETVRGGVGDDTFSTTGALSVSVDAGAGDDTLLGSSGDDSFGLTGSANSVGLAGGTFENIEIVLGSGGTDTVNGAATGTDFIISSDTTGLAEEIAFIDVDGFKGGAGDDSFTLTESISLTIDAGAGFDTVNASSDDDTFGITTNNNEVLYQSGTFQNIERVEAGLGNDSIAGSDASDAFALNSPNSITVSGIEFKDIVNVDGGNGIDSVMGTADAEAYLVTGDEAFTAQNMIFSDIESVDGNGGNDSVTAGGASGSTFELETVQQGTVDNIHFSNILAGFAGGVHGDTFDLASTFTNGTINGGDGDDHFIVASTNEGVTILGGDDADTLTVNGSAVTWVLDDSQFNAGNGTASEGTGQITFNSIATINNNSDAWDLSTVDDVTVTETQIVTPSIAFNYSANPLEVSLHTGNVQMDGFSANREDGLSQLQITSTGAVEGEGLVAVDNLNIIADGAVSLNTAVNEIDVMSGSDITLTQAGDLIIHNMTSGEEGAVSVLADSDISIGVINTGSGGSVDVTTTDGGLIALEPTLLVDGGVVNIQSGQITLSAVNGVLGDSPENPFYIFTHESIHFDSFRFISPLVRGPGQNNITTLGEEISSLAERSVYNGVIGAVHPLADELVVIDPAIFTALTPYVSASIALNTEGLHDEYLAKKSSDAQLAQEAAQAEAESRAQAQTEKRIAQQALAETATRTIAKSEAHAEEERLREEERLTQLQVLGEQLRVSQIGEQQNAEQKDNDEERAEALRIASLAGVDETMEKQSPSAGVLAEKPLQEAEESLHTIAETKPVKKMASTPADNDQKLSWFEKMMKNYWEPLKKKFKAIFEN